MAKEENLNGQLMYKRTFHLIKNQKKCKPNDSISCTFELHEKESLITSGLSQEKGNQSSYICQHANGENGFGLGYIEVRMRGSGVREILASLPVFSYVSLGGGIQRNSTATLLSPSD